MKSVPISKIDALIASLENVLKMRLEDIKKHSPEIPDWEGLIKAEMIETLRGIEKESEEMIPLSTVEARIKQLKEKEHLPYINEPIPSWIVINELEHLFPEYYNSPKGGIKKTGSNTNKET